MKIRSVNPFTAQVVEEFDLQDLHHCRKAVERAREASEAWAHAPLEDRLALIEKTGRVLERSQDRYARIITEEMGKPISQSRAEIEKCAFLCRYYAREAPSFLQDEPSPTEHHDSYVTYEPLGVLLGIMPWNYPFWQVLRFAIPALTAGNACLLKHASNVPRSALETERIFREAGLDAGVFQTLLMDARTTMRLLEEDGLDGVSLTGSLSAGSQVGAAAGRGIKKLVLELGGSDPFIVLDDADLESAAETGLLSRMINGGQSCIAAKRFIVMESVAQAFQEKLVRGLKSLRVGDPMDEETQVGPLAAKDFAGILEAQVEDAKQKGASVVYGPEPPEGEGFFFRPALLTEVKPSMRVLKEEVFGPVAPIVVVADEEEAVRAANETEFGLGAAVWSADVERAVRLSRKIRAGFVAVNDMVKSDPRLPFGGVKKSGVGRELSHFGLKEFVNVKTMAVRR